MQTQQQSTNSEMDFLLRASDVTRRLNICDATLWRLVARGDFPKPTKIGRASRWTERVVSDWIAARAPKAA